MLNIIYIGDDNCYSTSYHRAAALKRLGNEVTIFNPYGFNHGLLGSKIYSFIHYRSGYRFIQSQMEKWLTQTLSTVPRPDLIWVDSGELFGPNPVKELRKFKCPIILYNLDDPTGKRDNQRFYSLKKAIPYYDKVVVVRKETEEEIKRLNQTVVMRVFRSYDESAHMPLPWDSTLISKFASEVSFIGTWIPGEKRDDFILDLIKSRIPLCIWGSQWQKSPNWKYIRPYYKGAPLTGQQYVAAIQSSKVCLGLLSKGNRDLHTQRSLEIPFSGGILCAERTPEHQELYREGLEAVFWSDAKECAETCHNLLSKDGLREQIRTAGMKRVRSLGVGNEDICRKILESL